MVVLVPNGVAGRGTAVYLDCTEGRRWHSGQKIRVHFAGKAKRPDAIKLQPIRRVDNIAHPQYTGTAFVGISGLKPVQATFLLNLQPTIPPISGISALEKGCLLLRCLTDMVGRRTPNAVFMRFGSFGILQEVPSLAFSEVDAALVRAWLVERKLFVLIGKKRLCC